MLFRSWNISACQKKLNPTELIDELFDRHAKYKYTRIGIESTIYYQAIQPFLAEEQRKRNIYLPIMAVKHNGISKEIRIRGLLPRYENGGIYHITGETEELESQLIRFPKATHDDIMDSLAYQNQIVTHVVKPLTFQEDFYSSTRVDKRTGYPL